MYSNAFDMILELVVWLIVVGSVCTLQTKLAGPKIKEFFDEHNDVLDRAIGMLCATLYGSVAFTIFVIASLKIVVTLIYLV